MSKCYESGIWLALTSLMGVVLGCLYEGKLFINVHIYDMIYNVILPWEASVPGMNTYN